jgi:DNA mismatch repair protein MutL
MAERTIHILPEQVASQIAAGEVVERPASAVKELVENSLDAGSRSIAVEIERGGLGLISVVDDGCGMGRDDAILSVRRHATSKIRGASDLIAIRTLGFRGEALASIASVSHLALKTRRAADPSGVELILSGGEIQEERECAIAAGTRIEARDLFFNTPARLKFMKSEAAEKSAVAEVIQRLALANHSISFALTADGRELFLLTRASNLLERIRQVFGPKLAAGMLPFDASRPGLRVSGFAMTSQESFASARMIFTFVNGRWVRDKMLARAISQAYETAIPRGRYPAVFLFVEVRHEDVDVNVHPMKTEVRFRNPGALFEVVYHALRERLADQTAQRQSRPSLPAGTPAAPGGSVPGHDTAGALQGSSAVAAQSGLPRLPEAAVYRPAQEAGDVADDRPLRLVADSASAAFASQRPLNLGYASRPEHDSPREHAIPIYSELRILGQVFAGYIALEDEDGILLVDQHAAHERVTFEKLRAELKNGGIEVQAMLAPVTVDLNPARAAAVQASLSELQAIGFDVEPFGPATLVLKGVPAVFASEDGARLLSDMIDSMGEHGFRPARDGAFEDLLKQMACHGSVRVGRALEEREIRELLAELDRTEFKTNCPHGRPVHIRFARGQIERMFRR